MDTNGDQILSDFELSKAKKSASNESEVRGLSALIDVEKMLSGDGISQSELSKFEARSAFEIIARDKHQKADLEHRVFWPSVVGMAVGAGIAAFTEQKVYSSIMLINAGQAAAKSISGWFLEDNIEEHYNASALPAIRKVFDSGK